jgi:putative DNA primase/helicase
MKHETKTTGSVANKLATEILKTNHFAQDAGGKLYRSNGGAYRQRGDEYIRRAVASHLAAWDDMPSWSSRLANETVELIRVRSPYLWERPPQGVLNLLNGLLDVSTRTLRPHDPKHLSTIQLPVNFDADAVCPFIDRFIEEIFPNDTTLVPWELVGWLMMPFTGLQKAILLLGDGGNGKSAFLNLVTHFLGKSNVSGVSLHQLEGNRFATAGLVGKLANICADLPSQHLEGTSIFKQIVGEDRLMGENKHGTPFEFDCFARLIFSANEPPRSSDSTSGFYRRWVVIPFDAVIQNPLPKAQLEARILQPSELSGLLNKALDGLQRIRQQCGFSVSKSMHDAANDFRSTTDPLAVWLDRFTVDDLDCFTSTETLRLAYNADCERRGQRTISDKAFSQAIVRLRPKALRTQKTVGGKRRWGFAGIGYTGCDDARDAPDAPD